MKLGNGVKSSLVFTISSLFNKGITFLTVPIFTRIMSTEQIGIVNTYGSWHSILGVFASLSLTAGSFSIAMHEFRDKRDQYESAALGLTTLSSGLMIAIYILFFDSINRLINLPWQLNVLMLIGFVLQPAVDFWMARQRFEYKYKLIAIVSTGTAILSACLAVATVVVMNNNGDTELATGRLYATYAVHYIIAIVIYIFIFAKGKVFFHKEYWKFGLSLSIPLIVHALAKHILDASDKIMIQQIVGYSATGIYGTLYSISSLSLIIWNAINVSLVPYSFSKLDAGKEGEKKLNSLIVPIMIIYSVFAIAFAMLSPEIVKILATDEYYEAIYMVPPVAAGIFFTSLYNIMGNILLYHKKTKNIMYATLVAAVVNVALNYIFIKLYGYMAAAYTTLFANIVLALMQFLMAKRIHGHVPYNNKALLTISMVVTIVVLSCNILYQFTVLRFAIIGSIIIICFVMRKRIISIVRQMMNNA